MIITYLTVTLDNNNIDRLRAVESTTTAGVALLLEYLNNINSQRKIKSWIISNTPIKSNPLAYSLVE